MLHYCSCEEHLETDTFLLSGYAACRVGKRASDARSYDKHREARKLYDTTRYIENPERQKRAKARASQQRADALEHCREVVRNWSKTDRGRARRQSLESDRRARKLGAYVENVDREVVFLNDAGICQWQYCEEASPFVDPANWHLDHIVALANGGEHSYANTQVTHPVCNLKKH